MTSTFNATMCSEKNTVDDTIMTWAASDSNLSHIGINDCTLCENISSDVVRVGWALYNSLDCGDLSLASFWIVNANFVCRKDTNKIVATGFAVDLPLYFSNQSELLLTADFCPSLATSLNSATACGLSA
jgi:hypothetical protein|tara:strand:- start:340 stop:726 length:387 start_codon:yes stop_codon:yes gene_type:complete